MIEIVVGICFVAGSALILIAALGIVRLPDLFTRMHANSKASTLGLGLVAVGAGVCFPSALVRFESLLIIVFIFLTVPISSHMIARAAYLLKIPLWPGTLTDEMKGCYDLKERVLRSQPAENTDSGSAGGQGDRHRPPEGEDADGSNRT
jgi:multicomponent Na+:H+ antiporter subunit G